MNLGEARLHRVYGTSWSSLGLVSFPWVDRPLWTIERPWEGNAPFTSCIPPRIYVVRWTWSPKFGRFTWQVMDVPERTGIRWHRANFARDVQGCIGPGLRVGGERTAPCSRLQCRTHAACPGNDSSCPSPTCSPSKFPPMASARSRLTSFLVIYVSNGRRSVLIDASHFNHLLHRVRGRALFRR